MNRQDLFQFLCVVTTVGTTSSFISNPVLVSLCCYLGRQCQTLLSSCFSFFVLLLFCILSSREVLELFQFLCVVTMRPAFYQRICHVLVSLCCYLLQMLDGQIDVLFQFLCVVTFHQISGQYIMPYVLVSLCCYTFLPSYPHQLPNSFSFFVLLQFLDRIRKASAISFSFFVLLH